MRILKAVILGMALFLAQPVVAGPYEDGLTAWKRKDYATALRVWRNLAQQGHDRAQDKIGNMYFHGQGVPQSYEEAVRWFRKAAEGGNVGAQFFLGNIYESGLEIPQNYTEAMKWYRKAAEQGNPFSQNNLGIMYLYGRGVSQNYILAHMWFNLAAATMLQSSRKNRDFVARKMTTSQIAEAQKLAVECLRKNYKGC